MTNKLSRGSPSYNIMRQHKDSIMRWAQVYTFNMDGWLALPVPNVPNSYWAHPATKMVVAGGKSTALPHDSWSVMPDLETIGCPAQVITIGGRVVVCGENELFGLYIVSTDRLYRLVQYAIRFDCFRKLDIKKGNCSIGRQGRSVAGAQDCGC